MIDGLHKRIKLIKDINDKMMKSQTKILLYLIIFAIFDMVIPIPFAALLLIYILLEKPAWFKNLVSEIYGN
jgi:hypothetical protein